jgi:hypothetical protein
MYSGKERRYLELPLWTLVEGRRNLPMSVFVATDDHRPVQLAGQQGCPPNPFP